MGWHEGKGCGLLLLNQGRRKSMQIIKAVFYLTFEANYRSLPNVALLNATIASYDLNDAE